MDEEVLEDILSAIPDDMTISDMAIIFVNVMIHFDMEYDYDKVLVVMNHFMEAYNGERVARMH